MSELIAKTTFTDQVTARAYVESCENAFAAQVQKVAERILEHPECKLLGLGGPTCAGKSTTAKHLIHRLEAEGKHVHIISIDDFFRDQPEIRTPKGNGHEYRKVDLDSIDALDFPLFCRCVDELMHNGVTQIPRYDLSVSRRTGSEEYRIKDENDLFLFEGIQTVYPEITDLLEQYPYFSMFICVRRDLRLGETVFHPNRIRLMRRLVRDYYRRAATPDFTLFLWEGVRENEERGIFPFADHCMAQLDSTMGYEIGMLRPYLETILPTILDSDAYGKIAADILHDIQSAQPLSPELLPEIALYREFVGKVN
ncbi:MAG: hypothetical protein IJW40_04760 [Clostridia bacterium]|nr:hypothetical protein [Clostridia bacterium]